MGKEILVNNQIKGLFCILFSVFETIGILLHKYGILDTSRFSYGWCEVLSLFLCSVVLSYIFVDFFINLISRTYTNNKQVKTIRGKQYIYIYIAVCWLIWIVAFFPGSPFWDMSYQLAQYYKLQKLNLHPPFSTLIMGLCMDLGKCIFQSDNMGFFLYILLQFFLLSFACTKTCWLIFRITNNHKVCVAITLFYALFPLFGATVQCGMKDSISYALTLLTMVNIYTLFWELHDDRITVKNLIILILVAFLGCLYRKEMVYIYSVVITVFFLYLVITKDRIKNYFLYAIAVLMAVWLSGPFSNMVIAGEVFKQSPPSEGAESLSIPLQHVARYVTFFEDEITEDEKNIIGSCFSYGYEGIKSNYNPNLSDPIKYNFSTKLADENGFWGVYMGLLKRNPFRLAESVLASSYGYISIVPSVPATLHNAPTNGLPGSRIPVLFINDFTGEKESQGYKTEYYARTGNLRELLKDYIYAFDVPWNFLYSFGFYTWLVILLFVIAVKQKGWSVIVYYTLPVMLILVCIASPVNDYGRYYMGNIYIIPLLLGDVLVTKPQIAYKEN